jgi:hypothetical protein
LREQADRIKGFPRTREADMSKYELVKQYLEEMALTTVNEDAAREMVVVEDEENGIKNLVVHCSDPILVLEQPIMKVPERRDELFEQLLKWNRELVHGAFVLDEAGELVLFRDTLQLESLDRNELEASLKALSLALAEYSSQLLEFAK